MNKSKKTNYFYVITNKPKIMKSISTTIFALLFPVILFSQGSPFINGSSGGNHSRINVNLKTSGEELYNQLGYAGNSLASQNFNTGYEEYDVESADDFTVPKGKSWLIDEVVISFFYWTIPSPTVSLTVKFYTDNGGMPGDLHTEFSNIIVNTTDLTNTGAIALPGVANLNEGTYWISVVANYGVPGDGGSTFQFFWDMLTETNGSIAKIRNPGDVMDIGIEDWTNINSVVNPVYIGLSFALYGNESKAVPFPLIGSILAFLGIGGVSFLGLRKRRK
jgi:hypothetical protein